MNPPDKLQPAATLAAALPQALPAKASDGQKRTAANAPAQAARGALASDLLDRALTALIAFFTSLRLTVVCLALGMVLVFFGTMAQDPLGLYLSQEKFFRSFTVSAPAMWAAIKKALEMFHFYLTPSSATDVLRGSLFPVFPGGYLLGGVLLLNLVSSHFKRFKLSRDKAGIWLVHLGLILLLLGQLMTDMLARESAMHLREGETRNYSESERQAELVLVNTTAPDLDTVVAIPQGLLTRGRDIHPSALPFTLRVKKFFVNSSISDRAAEATEPAAASQGIGPRAVLKELPRVTEMNRRDVPSAVVEVVTPEGALGSWVVSEYIDRPQGFTWNNQTWQLSMRPRRYYKPYSLQLEEFKHDIYPGTDIPKNFSSRVKLQRPDTGENREVLIHMNSPLRYAGETYYQASFDPDNHGSVLEVVHNPSWLTPYFSCILVGLGLVLQFTTHLLGFTFKRKAV